LVLLLLFGFTVQGFSQSEQNLPPNYHFRGNISANHNGISLIPSFSLGRPAFIFDLSIGGERMSFDPEIRFAMDGKPWSFIFWWRYRLVRSEKFKLRAGVHPSFVFRSLPQPNLNGTTGAHEIFTVQRYFAGELAPSYNVTKNFRVGGYYLHALGLDPGLTKHTQFMALNSSITQVSVSEQFYLNVSPQVFYLKMGELDGFYTNASLAILRRAFPLALTTMASKSISTRIPSKDFIFNVGLVYTVNRDYVRKSVL
jgi:hypothetical protein